MNHRLLYFGRSVVGLFYSPGRSTQLVNFLFQNVPGSVDKEPWTQLRLEDHGVQDGLWLWQDEKLISKQPSTESMANHLMSQVCYALAYESRKGLLLHSAAVQIKGQSTIMPGKTGAGKSTLTAWLINHGCLYQSDEMAYIAGGTVKVSGFSRPITIKAPARSLLQELLSEEGAPAGVLKGEPVDMITPELLGTQVVSGLSSLSLIIFPEYQVDQSLEMVSLTSAHTAFELMKCLANARNLADHGLSEAVRLASRTPAYSVSYGDTEQAGRAILKLFKD